MDNDFETLISGQQFKKLYDKKSNVITEKYGLNKIEIEILLFLKNSPFDTARDIAEWKFFSKAYISQAIEHLTESGYLTGRADEQDRRCIHLILTQKANPLCEELVRLRERMERIICKNITEEEHRVMMGIAKKIVQNINDELLGDM